MLSIYPAIFTESKQGGYAVVFPDLNHLATCGDSMEEAMEMAIDCLAGYIYSERLDGHAIPVPTHLPQVDVHSEDIEELADEVVSQFVTAVAVDVDSYAKEHFAKGEERKVA